MRFGQQFEFHKIPEWYTMYLNYHLFKDMIDIFIMKVMEGDLIMLNQCWRFKKEEFTNTWNLEIEDCDPDNACKANEDTAVDSKSVVSAVKQLSLRKYNPQDGSVSRMRASS